MKLQTASNHYEDCLGEGTVAVQALIGGRWEEIKLHNTLYMQRGLNLFSHSLILK